MWRQLLKYSGKEESLTAFLWLIVILIFVVAPLSHHLPVFEPLVSIVMGMLLIAGLLSAVGSPRLAFAAFFCVVLTFSIALLKVAMGRTPLLLMLAELFSLAALGLFLYMMTRQTLKAGQITPHRIKGGIAVYLLIGMLWSKIFHLIALSDPQAFTGMDALSPFPTFVYFSFVTLTTLGYGDILPVNDFARAMVGAEALLGQLFPTIFIARLVTLQLETNKTVQRRESH